MTLTALFLSLSHTLSLTYSHSHLQPSNSIME